MRVLTVRQPWAWAILHAGKDVENRTRNIAGDYRGPIAIHAALACDWDTRLPIGDTPHPTSVALLRGDIIGVVDLIGVHRATRVLDVSFVADSGEHLTCCTSPWAELHADWHLELASPRSIWPPIQHRGGLALRHLDPETTATITAALAATEPKEPHR